MQRKIYGTMLVLISLFVLNGCCTLSRSDKEFLEELKSYDVNPTQEKAKDPLAAGALNLLPGFGNFYLAIGTDEKPQWLYGIGNLLFWPWSPVWGMPQAYIDAKTINKKETVYYYRYDPEGKKKLDQLKQKSGDKQPQDVNEPPQNSDKQLQNGNEQPQDGDKQPQ